MSLADFERFRDDPKPKPLVQVLAHLAGPVLAFDQSLAHTGWAIVDAQGVVAVTGMLTTPSAGGPIGNVERAVEIAAQVEDLLAERASEYQAIVMETPPAGYGMKRPESSLLAAAAIHTAADRRGLMVEYVGAQRAKRVMTGKPNASKAEMKAAVCARTNLADCKPCNEHVSDAVGLALVAMGVVE